METDIHIREATPADKDGVLGIHDNVYDGRDYLKDYYDYYMVEPHITGFLAELHGEIVGFVAQCLVDGGETVVDRAGRVRPDMEGQGVYRTLMNHVAAVNKSSGIVKRRAFTALDNKPVEFLAKHELLMKRKIIHIKYEVTLKKTLKGFGQENKVRRIKQSELIESFACDGIANYLFPNKRVVIDWTPFRLLESNVPIARGRDTIFASDVATGCHFNHVGHLSCSSVFKCSNPGFKANMDVYGTDAASFQYHLLFHLKRILKVYTGPGILAIYIESDVWDSIDKEMVHTLFDDLGLNILELRYFADQTCFENYL